MTVMTTRTEIRTVAGEQVCTARSDPGGARHGGEAE